MNPISLMADAEKLSIGQLQQAVKNGTVPAYIGIPMMQEKIKQSKQAQAPQAPAEPPIAHQVMAQAAGIDQVPSNLPTETMNDGGIVAFARGGASDMTFDDDENDDYEEYQLAQDEAEHQNSMALHQQMAQSEGSRTPVNRTPPVEGGIAAGKNYDEHQYVRGVGNGHKGIDYAMPVGTPISPKVEGTLRYNTRDPKGWGNAAEIVDDNGRVLQRFAHLSRFEAPEGTRVKPGQVIAMSGNTGRSTGPHLHVENFYADGGIARLNKGGIPRYQSQGLVDADVPEAQELTDLYKPRSIWENIKGAGKYAFDPAYRAFVEEGGNKGDISLDAYRSLGNDSGRPKNKYSASFPTGIVPSNRPPKFLRNLETITGINTTPKNDALINQSLPNSFEPNPVPKTQTGRVVSDIITDLSGPGRARSSTPISNEPEFGHRMAEYEEGEANTHPSDFLGNVKKPTGIVAPAGASTGANNAQGSGIVSPDQKETVSNEPKERSAYDEFMDYFKKGHEDLKSQKQEDKYMAILQAGLGMMAGTSPNALANIGQGASAGIAHYGASAKQRAAEQNALLKGEMTARRYQEMGEDRRALQKINQERYGDLLNQRQIENSDRVQGRTDRLNLDEKNLMMRTEGLIEKNLSAREAQIENAVLKQFKLNPLGQLEPDQMEKYNQAVAKAKAEDSSLKGMHSRMGKLQKSLYDMDYIAPDYGYSPNAGRLRFDANGKQIK